MAIANLSHTSLTSTVIDLVVTTSEKYIKYLTIMGSLLEYPA